MSKWQPIETAPHVKDVPLLFVTTGGDYTIGTWDGDDWDMQGARTLAPYTHYMTLPPSPEHEP